ncbi:unnamed protein product [Withania somnifera]
MSCPTSLPVNETFFISHGSPTLSIDESLPARHFLKGFKERFLSHQKPKSILVISAHWETSEPTVNSIRGRHDTIHDFYGFPKSMYQLKYPAPGSPELAKRVKEVLVASGFATVYEDKNAVWIMVRGFLSCSCIQKQTFQSASFRHQDVNNYDIKAPHAKVAHPWPEHIYPLHVALGAAGEGVKGDLIHHSWDLGALSYASYKFSNSLNRSS